MILRSFLGPASELKAERCLRTVTANGKSDTTEMIRAKGRYQGREAELIETKNPVGASVWEFRQRNSLGEWDSQIFFQGSADTIVSKSSQDSAGWTVHTRQQNLASTELAKKGEMASLATEEQRVKERATWADLDQALVGMESAKQGEAYRQFRQASGNGPLKILQGKSNQEFTDGKKSNSASLIVENAHGQRWTLLSDDVLAQEFKDGSQRMCSVTSNDGERLEVSKEGTAIRFRKDGQCQILEGEEWKPYKATGLTKPAANTWKAVKPKADYGSMAGLEKAEGGLKLGKALVGLGAFTMSLDLINGRWESAGRKAADVSVGVSGLMRGSQSIAQRSAVGWSRLSNTGRLLGRVGLAGGALFAVSDIAQGEYTKGSLGAAATAGTAYAMWGTASCAGPVGWGVAAVATAGTFLYDYDSSTSVANFQL